MRSWLDQFNMSFIENVFDNIHDGVKILDKDGRIVFINQSGAKNLEINREEWIGRHINELIPNSVIYRCLVTGKPQVHQYNVVNGRPFIADAYPIIFDGEVVGTICTHKDDNEIAQLKESFEALSQYIRFLKNELQRVKTLPAELDNFIVSNESPLMDQLSKILKIANTDMPILIRGESGVGKELIAKSIHDCSNRIGKPYIAINCAAIPESLLESEMFGYDEGSFTGAKRSGKKGKFELANGGSIFLDEIGDMSYQLQAKLLRVLQQKELTRVGGLQAIDLDVRVIAATNQNLEEMIANNKFREDLYYRINGFSIYIPPLRERKMDIEILMQHFLAEFSRKYNRLVGISKEAHDFLIHHHLSGNVRELRNALEHGYVLTDTYEIQIKDLPSFIRNEGIQANSNPDEKVPLTSSSTYGFDPLANLNLNENVEHLEVRLVNEALQRCNNNRSEAIKLLGISRQSFYDRLKRYEISLKSSTLFKA
jgi:transcriptional regulator with PAS, ATPase and Fis domain